MENETKNVLVLGATGGSGRAAVVELLERGHTVTAFARRALPMEHERLRVVQGDALVASDVEAAMRDQDAVIVALGIQENPALVRLRGARATSTSVRSEGTRNVLRAMAAHGVRRLIVQSTFGVGETRDLLGFTDRLLFSLLLRPQIQDTEVQEQLVRDADIDWTFAQPVHLTDDDTGAKEPHLSTRGDTRDMKVSRAQVARFLAHAVTSPDHLYASVTISG